MTVEKVLSFYQDLSRVRLLTGTGKMLNTSINKEAAEEPSKRPSFTEETSPLETKLIVQRSATEIVLRDMLAEERARVDTLNEVIWELKEENGKLKALLNERKGGTAADAGFSSAVGAL